MTSVKPLFLPPLPEGTEVHVAMLADRLLQAIRQRLDQHDWDGLRPSHFRLMGCVPPSGTTITELSAPLSMTKQAVGQFVAHLRETGHLDLRPDGRDRRRRVVVRTERGDRVVGEVAAAVADLERRWSAEVGAEDYAVFRRVLTQLAGG